MTDSNPDPRTLPPEPQRLPSESPHLPGNYLKNVIGTGNRLREFLTVYCQLLNIPYFSQRSVNPFRSRARGIEYTLRGNYHGVLNNL
jgi:hypothetical protein